MRRLVGYVPVLLSVLSAAGGVVWGVSAASPGGPLPESVRFLWLMAAAFGVHGLWGLSRSAEMANGQRREWLWLAGVYIVSAALGSEQIWGGRLDSAVWPALWLILLLGASVVIQARRLYAPADLIQETAANILLWSLITAAAGAGGTFWLVRTALGACLACAAAGLLLVWGVQRALGAIRSGDTSFSGRDPLAAMIVAGLAGAIPWLVGDPGPWPLSILAAAALGVAWLSPPARRLLGRGLERLPPRSELKLARAVRAAIEDVRHAEGLDELGAALVPLAKALPAGGVGLVCFEPDRVLVLRGDEIERREPGPGRPLHLLLAPPSGPRPLLASQVVDRAVRAAEVRGASDLIEELDADLVIPLPGGPGGALTGALLVGRPRWGKLWGRLRGRRADRLARFGERLGPYLGAALRLEEVDSRIDELGREHLALGDHLDRLGHRLERLAEENRLLRADRAGTTRAEIVGRSGAMKALLEEIEQAASRGTHLLIDGEAGTGRGLVARTIHESGPRRQGPLVRMSCTSLPPESHLAALLGSSSDDERPRPGLIELADGGTLVVEEVGSLALEAQSELVRVLASGEVARLGGAGLRQVDVRVMGTTGRSSPLIRDREVILPELRLRLGVVEVKVPSLRERRGDIAELARHFLERAAKRHGLAIDALASGAVGRLEEYSWPGNVRQLRAVVEHAALMARGSRVEASDIPDLTARELRVEPADVPEPTTREPRAEPADIPSAVEARAERQAAVPGDAELLEGTFEEIERRVLAAALDRAGGNKAEAARLLDMKRTTFNSRCKKLGLG